MAKTLASFVHVDHPEKGPVVLHPGDELPDWAEDQVTNPKAFENDDEDSQPFTTYDNYSDDQLRNAVDTKNLDGRADDDKIKVRKNASRQALISALVQDDANPPEIVDVAGAGPQGGDEQN